MVDQDSILQHQRDLFDPTREQVAPTKDALNGYSRSIQWNRKMVQLLKPRLGDATASRPERLSRPGPGWCGTHAARLRMYRSRKGQDGLAKPTSSSNARR